MTTVLTWIIGAGGLLGQALARQAHALAPSPVIPWNDHGQALEALRHHARDFETRAGHEPWRIIWAAGAATTATPRDDAWREYNALEAFLVSLRGALPQGKGSFFLASSAGGVYAGSESPPFSDTSSTHPLSAYGELKLAQELLAREILNGLVPTTIGRISNLYGPGQNLFKLQGLISRLALTAITKDPISIFVPLNTLRDYIYVDDAARVALSWIEKSERDHEPVARSVIIGSGEPTSVAALIHLTESVARTKIPLALGTHHISQGQAYDLRLIPTPIGDQPQRKMTPLPAGMKNVYLDVLTRFQSGLLVR